jgi:Carbohydrate esterase, sialic acid-specific acetylesterase
VGASSKFADGRFSGVPTGGPYQLSATLKIGGTKQELKVGPLFVGDLWVLAGQSNMVGYGNLIDVTPPHPKVMALGMDGRWAQAREPLHWEIDAIDPVHLRLLGFASADSATRAKHSQDFHKGRAQGAGLGLPFAATLVEHTKVPIGLVLCAHGGTSMKQWSPARKGEGGHSLYGSMLLQVQRAGGGRVKGVLWWQGESDAGSPSYAQVFPVFIAAVRDDLHQPDLPFYFVQITRLVYGRADVDPKGRNPVREVQRLIPARVPHTAVVSAIDLELDDLGHVGTHGLKRLGRRLALIALREHYGQKGATTPNLDKVVKGPGDPAALVVKFKGVNVRESPALGLQPARRIGGFSIRKPDGAEVPLIFEAAVGPDRDSVLLKLTGPIPKGAQLWYGYGLDPYCNLTDSFDMAVPAFGPVPLDDVK